MKTEKPKERKLQKKKDTIKLHIIQNNSNIAIQQKKLLIEKKAFLNKTFQLS